MFTFSFEVFKFETVFEVVLIVVVDVVVVVVAVVSVPVGFFLSTFVFEVVSFAFISSLLSTRISSLKLLQTISTPH